MKLWLGVGAVAIVLVAALLRVGEREPRPALGVPDAAGDPREDPRPLSTPVPAATSAVPELADEVAPSSRKRAAVDTQTPLGFAPLSGVVSARGGARLAGAVVRVASFERRDGAPRFAYETTTGLKGDFAFELAVGAEATARAGQEYLIHASSPGYATATLLTPPMRPGLGVERNLSLDPHARSLCEVEVLVRDGDGPLLGVLALLFDRDDSPASLPRRVDVGPTDSEGRVVLSSNALGSKTIVVRDYRGAHQLHQEEILRRSPGRSSHTVVLQTGLVIAGVVRSVEGELYDGIKLRLDPDAELEVGQTLIVSQPGGRFRAEGLAAGAHLLESLTDDRRWSPFRVHVTAGDEELVLVLKEPTDDVDHGLHLGEVHGTLHAPSAAAGLQNIWIEDVSALDYQALEGDLLPNLLSDRSRVQRMSSITILGALGAPDLRVLGEGVVYELAGGFVDFHFIGLEDGDYCVLARIPGTGPTFAGPFSIRNQALVSGVQLVPPPVTTVSGRVVDVEGRPVVGAHVFATGTGARSEARIREARAGKGNGADSDVDGNFELDVPAGLPLFVVATRGPLNPARTGPMTLTAGSATSGVQIAFSESDP